MQIRCGAVLFLLLSPVTAAAYSQFTHQTLIDVTWERAIRVPGESKIVDRTFAELLSHLVQEKTLPPVEIRDRMLGFFQEESKPTRLTQKEWIRVRANKQALLQRYPPPG